MIFKKGGVILVFDRTGSGSKQCQMVFLLPFLYSLPPLLSFLALIIFFPLLLSACSLLHSVWWLPSLLLQTFFLHMTIIWPHGIRFPGWCPQRQMAVFPVSLRGKCLRRKGFCRGQGLERSDWPTVWFLSY